MTMVNRCDCCCECGSACSNGYCIRSMQWIGTTSGTTTGTPNGSSCVCTDLDGVPFGIRKGAGTSITAATWNATRPPYSTTDAKTGTKVCSWVESDDVNGSCTSGATQITGSAITTYYGDDDKWHMIYEGQYNGPTANASALMAGDAEFPGGGAATNCGTPGEVSPTFSLSIPLTAYDPLDPTQPAPSPYGQDCYAPTSILIEGDPQ
jgi:hypothetical protein